MANDHVATNSDPIAMRVVNMNGQASDTSAPGQQPSFGGVLLSTVARPLCSGAAFTLKADAQASAIVAVDGWEVEVREGTKIIVARGGDERSHEDAFRAGLMYAQKGLDLMSISGSNNLVINSFSEEHLVWWPEPTGLVLRITFLRPSIKLGVGDVTLVVGGQRQASGSNTVWHESFRYFRLSQSTDDLFDAFRNAYLALESILSSIAPQRLKPNGQVAEAEGAWFGRALAEAGRVVNLAPFVSPSDPDPVQSLKVEIYSDMRGAMSHAKSGRKVLLPQNESDRQQVTASLRKLVNLYLALAKAHLQVQRSGGGVFATFFRMMFGPVLDALTVSVAPEKVAGGERTVAVPLSPMSSAESSESFLVRRSWYAPASDLIGLGNIREIHGDNAGGELVLSVTLDEQLILGTVDRVEAVLGLRGFNTRQPRDVYSI